MKRTQRNGVKWQRGVLAQACRIAGAAYPNETGGILVGWYSAEMIHVEQFLEVPDAEARHARYTRRHDAAQVALEELRAREGINSELGYVGEWHAHPAAQPASPRDLAALRRIALRIGEPVALVVLSFSGEWVPSAFTAKRIGFQRVRRHNVTREEFTA